MVEAKRTKRLALLTRRRARTASERERVAQAIAATAAGVDRLTTAGCVAAYASIAGEPGTGPLRQILRGRGIDVLLPVVLDQNETRPQLDWSRDDRGDPSGDQGDQDDQALEPGRLGLPEPTGPRLGVRAIERAQVVLVPALAVDDSGARLGRGGGYYDVALTLAAPGTLVLAVVHDDELLAAARDPLPIEPHDRRVDGAITPSRWVLFEPSPV